LTSTAVLTSHRNLVAQIVLYGQRGREHLQTLKARGQTPDYKTLACLPTAHIAGLVSYFCYGPFLGGRVYWMPNFDFPNFLAYHRKYRLTWLFSVPPIYLLIAKSPSVTDHFDSIEVAVSAAAPLGRDLQYLASTKLGKGKVLISQVWGLSETTGAVTALPWHERDETGSVSSLLPSLSLRSVNQIFIARFAF
jgi:4-coumarate--CoA ligase